MLISILRKGGAVYEQVEESELVKLEGVVDDDNEHTTWVEYRFPNDDHIVHRSAHVTLKKWPAGMGGDVGTFL